MRKQQRPRSRVARLLMFTVGLLVFYGSYHWGTRHAPRNTGYRVLHLLESPAAIGPINLQDQYGNPFGEERFSGHWNLVLFGYTRSTEASRETLFLATDVVNRLADNPALQRATRALFVSVDPDHDTPQVIKAFMDRYDPSFLALTGPSAQIDLLAGQLGVRYRRAPADAGTIDHGTSIALVDPGAMLVGLFTGVVDAVSIASDLKQFVEKYQN